MFSIEARSKMARRWDARCPRYFLTGPKPKGLATPKPWGGRSDLLGQNPMPPFAIRGDVQEGPRHVLKGGIVKRGLPVIGSVENWWSVG